MPSPGAYVCLAIGYAIIGGHDLLMHMFPTTPHFVVKEWQINFWPESYLLGVVIALNIYGFAGVSANVRDSFKKFAPLVRTVADTSFGLYLFHYPLMYFFKALFNVAGLSSGWMFSTLIYVASFTTSMILALKCEEYKRGFASALRNLAAKAGYRKRFVAQA